MSRKLKGFLTSIVLIPCLLFLIQDANAASAKHKGWSETKAGSNVLYKRAVGETTWKGKYHYTRAQIVWPITGAVQTDSGRKWGKDHTKATSPWATADFAKAKTFYGS
ncbi:MULTISPECIES: hypothetical protein [Bacillus amyloliquefaciens group]|uniref:Lactococcin 972 family bacteriocin n=1 Tax=Bacillus amyloliquefaciens TaxID=1390 RepID=A0AAP4DHP6_BACAM|nr:MULTISPECIES: hypothetical protein [Bacillus amyloliquefaciens group]ERH54769.1 hypothetical protein O205_10035 [Bacillus amyloliquefaciens EGD-AQ14]MDF4193558.1 hypothetical protein [Bacillus amyloliquefaciens]MDF4212506.1 hypothetical protein [Bacillus amyloliquefaciens]MDH3074151.1 hypothetical protein [Bacillus velezensis]MDH3105771.1 hypothetical protein [Bacillus velezensis]